MKKYSTNNKISEISLRRLESIINQLRIFLCVLIITNFNSCNESYYGETVCSKLTAEEAGYIETLGPLIADVSYPEVDFANMRGFSNGKFRSCLNINRIQNNYIFYNGYGLRESGVLGMKTNPDEEILRSLRRILPPESLITLHSYFINLVENRIKNRTYLKAMAGENIYASEEINQWPTEIQRQRIDHIERCNKIEEYLNSLFESFMERENIEQYSKSIHSIAFQPIFIPAEVSVDNTGKFSLKSVVGVSTPIGNVSYSSGEIQNQKRVIVRYNGKERILLQDRRFNLFFPAKYGFNLMSDGEDVLIIEVVQKND